MNKKISAEILLFDNTVSNFEMGAENEESARLLVLKVKNKMLLRYEQL
jgi:hypothetical protein